MIETGGKSQIPEGLTLQGEAFAKLNLSLDILGRREDGYHDLCMVMHSVTLADQVTLKQTGETGVRVETNLHFLPNDEKNLAARAAAAYGEATGRGAEGLRIQIQKQIPVCAGMAGGSSDAAAVLRLLNRQNPTPLSVTELAKVGEKVGSDVPYCVLGGTALAEGRGERLTPLPPLPPCWFVLCKPPFPISTPELFGRVNCHKLRCRPDTEGLLRALEDGDLEGIARRMYNVFEDVLPPRQAAAIQRIKTSLIGSGALGAVMSGSGPTVFGLFEAEEAAQKALGNLKREYKDVFLVKSAPLV